MWAGFVDLIRMTLFAAAHVCGGSLGAGIIAVSAIVRLALLPITLRAAREARDHQARLDAPHGARIRAVLVQAPLLSGLFAAVRSGLGARVRFLWIADLAQPNSLLAGLVILLTGIVVSIPRAPSPSGAGATNTALTFVVGAGISAFFLWSASSAVLLSVGAGSFISALQSWLLARDRTAHRSDHGPVG